MIQYQNNNGAVFIINSMIYPCLQSSWRVKTKTKRLVFSIVLQFLSLSQMQLDHRKMDHESTPFLLNISLKCSCSRLSLKQLSWTGVKLVATEGPTRKKRNAPSLTALSKPASDEIIYSLNLFCLNCPQLERERGWQSPGIVSCTWYAWSCKATSKVIFLNFVTDLTSVLGLFVLAAFMYAARRLPHVFVPVGCASFASHWTEREPLHFER